MNENDGGNNVESTQVIRKTTTTTATEGVHYLENISPTELIDKSKKYFLFIS